MSFGEPSGLSWELLLLELIGEVDEIKEPNPRAFTHRVHGNGNRQMGLDGSSPARQTPEAVFETLLEAEAVQERPDGSPNDGLRYTEFVVLDELGYLPFSKIAGQLLFHLLSKLYQHTSVIIYQSRVR